MNSSRLGASPSNMPRATREYAGTAGKIASFVALPTGWNYGSGRPPSRALARNVLDFHGLLGDFGISETDAFPGEEGEILLRAYAGDRCAGFLFNADGSVDLSLEAGDVETLSKERASINDILALAREVAGTCGTYGSSTRGISIGGKAGSWSWRSRSTPETTPPRSLTSSVSSRVVASFALTSSGTTRPTSPAALPSSGPSRTATSRPAP